MSEYKVPLTKILKVENHPNADRLSVCTVFGFQVVTQKDKYKVGDHAIYIPIDSILSSQLEATLFPLDKDGNPPKITLHHNRVRQIKIRGFFSQGMLVDPSDVSSILGMDRVRRLGTYEEEEDLSVELGVTKYEPPTRAIHVPGTKSLRDKPFTNPFFRQYNGVTNLRWNPTKFDGREVVIQCKIHGSHVRFGRAPFVANTFWKKVKGLFRLNPKYEFVYGSNNVELTNRGGYKGFYGENIYAKVLKAYDVESKIKDGEFVHAEIYGDGIQANYTYGCGKGEHKLIIYDIRTMQEDGTQKWLNPEDCAQYAKDRGFDFVPVLYAGLFDNAILTELTSGPSVLCPSQKVREGVVVKDRYEYDQFQSKNCLKSINPAYLADDTNTDEH